MAKKRKQLTARQRAKLDRRKAKKAMDKGFLPAAD